MAAASPARRINQSTFNEAVAENIEEFEMDFAEAVSDAKEQFSGEGVDISDLVTDELGPAIGPEIVAAGGAELLAAIRGFRHPVERALASVAAASATGRAEGAFASGTELEAAKEAFSAVIALLSDNPGKSEETEAKKARIEATRDRCVGHGLIPAVCTLLDRTAHTCKGFQTRAPPASKEGDESAAIGAESSTVAAADGGEAAAPAEVPEAVLAAACEALEQGFVALRRLCYKSDRARKQVLTPAVDACLVGLKHWETSAAAAAAAGRCAGVVATKAEGFKRRLHAGGAVAMAMALLRTMDTDTEAVRGGCAVLRAVTAKDDPAATVAEGLEHAKVIAADGKTVPLLVGALSKACGLVAGHDPAWSRAADLMLGLRALHINNETCNALLDSGAVAKVILRGVSAATERFNVILTAAIAQGKATERGKLQAAARAEAEAEPGATAPAAPEAIAPAESEATAPAEPEPTAPEAESEGAADRAGSEEEEGLKRAVRVGLTLVKALCNSDAVKRAMVDTVLAAGGAGAAAGADWTGGGSRAAIGLPETSAAAAATSAAASAVAAGAGDAGLAGPVVGMLLMLRVLHVFRYHVDVSDQALSALSNAVLRVRENAKFLVDNGGAQAVLTMMRRFPWHPLVQRHGALVLRNAVSWDKSLIAAIVAAGAEPLLRAALEKHPAVAGEATRAALRDLVLD